MNEHRPFQVGTILTAANEALAPETLWGSEAGPQVTVDNVAVRVTAFYNRISDPIFNDTRYVVGRAGLDTLGPPRTILVGVAFTSRPGR